jgi:hypothetical protein
MRKVRGLVNFEIANGKTRPGELAVITSLAGSSQLLLLKAHPFLL